MVGAFSNGKDVRRDFITPLGTVDTNSSHGVNWEPFVRVYCDTEEPRICVDQSLNVALLQVEQDRGIIEIGQVGHVLATVILRGVHL